MFARRGHERLTHFVDVAAVSHAYGQTKPHARIAIMPVRHWRVDEFRVRHDHGDVIARHNNRAARANLLHPADDARDFHTVPDRDRSLRQNDQTADEIAGDILQTKSDAYANGASKNRQCSQMNTGILQNNETADPENDVADDLGNCVLKGTIESAAN